MMRNSTRERVPLQKSYDRADSIQIEELLAPVPVFPTDYRLSFVLCTALFFLWGVSNNLTDILVQQFRKSFSLSQIQAQLVQTAVFFGYFFMAMPAARVSRRYGYKAGILLGLVLFGAGTLLFWPAAIIGRYGFFLLALFIVGCGSATLETAANPLIAQFGPASTAERRLNFVQAFNPPGTILGVLLGTYFIFSGVVLSSDETARLSASGTLGTYMHQEIMRVVPTYIGLGLGVLSCAVLIGRTRFPAFATERFSGREGGRFVDLFPFRRLWFAVAAQFFYVGAQICTWSAYIPYIRQYTSLSERSTGLLLTGNLIAFGLGRIVSTSLMRVVVPAKLIRIYALINVGLLGIGILHPGVAGGMAILLTSFFMSIMYPTIFALGIKGLGPFTKLGGSTIVMAIVGGAVLPPASGWIAYETGSVALGYLIVAVAYVFVALYTFTVNAVMLDEPGYFELLRRD